MTETTPDRQPVPHSETKWIDPDEFRDFGYLQEINRVFLHPLGLALAIRRGEEHRPAEFVGVVDARDDPEGFIFGDGNRPEKAKALRVEAERDRRDEIRRAALGFVIQPATE